MTAEICRIASPERKAAIARELLEALPQWFGIPESREEYITASREQPFFAALDGETPLGFLCLKETGAATAELAVMGVRKDCHRQGIGRLLFQAYLAEGGRGRITVHSSPYAVEVYRHLGFSPTAEEQLSPDGIRYTPMVWEQT